MLRCCVSISTHLCAHVNNAIELSRKTGYQQHSGMALFQSTSDPITTHDTSEPPLPPKTPLKLTSPLATNLTFMFQDFFYLTIVNVIKFLTAAEDLIRFRKIHAVGLLRHLSLYLSKNKHSGLENAEKPYLINNIPNRFLTFR